MAALVDRQVGERQRDPDSEAEGACPVLLSSEAVLPQDPAEQQRGDGPGLLTLAPPDPADRWIVASVDCLAQPAQRQDTRSSGGKQLAGHRCPKGRPCAHRIWSRNGCDDRPHDRWTQREPARPCLFLARSRYCAAVRQLAGQMSSRKSLRISNGDMVWLQAGEDRRKDGWERNPACACQGGHPPSPMQCMQVERTGAPALLAAANGATGAAARATPCLQPRDSQSDHCPH